MPNASNEQKKARILLIVDIDDANLKYFFFVQSIQNKHASKTHRRVDRFNLIPLKSIY